MFYYKIIGNKKVYTLDSKNSQSAAPAKYSVEDAFSSQRITMKMRHKIFPFDS